MVSMTVVKRYPVAVFFGASVAIGWIVTIAVARLSGGTALLPLVAIPVSYVPAAAALVVLRVAGTEDDKRALRRRLATVRVDKRWYAVALLVPPLTHLTGIALATLAGGTFAIQPAMFALLPLLLITSLGEEIGWRGFAQPKLQERMTPLAAAIVIGFGWAAFHWVALLANAETPLAYVIVSTFQLMALSIILAILFNEGRQALILVVLAHAMYDAASIGVAPFASTGVPLVAFALSAAVTWVVAIGMLVVVGRTQPLASPSEATARPVGG
jgi:membrane protease YdiL (CAAX protease family)